VREARRPPGIRIMIIISGPLSSFALTENYHSASDFMGPLVQRERAGFNIEAKKGRKSLKLKEILDASG